MSADNDNGLELLRYIVEHQHELETLPKEQAKAEEVLRKSEKQQNTYSSVKPIEVSRSVNYDTLEIAEALKDVAENMSEYHAKYDENQRAAQDAISEVSRQLAEVNRKLDESNRKAEDLSHRIDESRTDEAKQGKFDRRIQIFVAIIGTLTLIATVLLGTLR